MEQKNIQSGNRNSRLVVFVIVLSLFVIGFGGYFIYDKVLSNSASKNNYREDNNYNNVDAAENSNEILNNEESVNLVGEWVAIGVIDEFGSGEFETYDFLGWPEVPTLEIRQNQIISMSLGEMGVRDGNLVETSTNEYKIVGEVRAEGYQWESNKVIQYNTDSNLIRLVTDNMPSRQIFFERR
ncbi:MAG: hypothetical protein FWC79_03525 [Oscillospiraceae bacterium]|nr:hypothetical protein [Oscillospiraceae bacterium]